MPKESRRARNIRKAGRTKLDRRICPNCRAEVFRWDRRKIQLCASCLRPFLWISAPEVLASKSPSQSKKRYSGKGSPALSTIEEHSEAGDNRSSSSSSSSSSSGSSWTDDNERTLRHNSLRRSVNGDVAAAFPNLKPYPKDNTVVSGPFDDPLPAHSTGSIPPEEWPIRVWEVFNQRNTSAPPQAAAVPLVAFNEQNTTAAPLLIRATTRSAAPRVTSPCPSSPRPTSPRPKPKTKRCRFRERFRRHRSEPIEPSPSLEDVIRIPEAVPRQRAMDLLHTLILARYSHGRVEHVDSITSPATAPQEPDGILQQHASDLHDALVRLEALGGGNDSEEGSTSSEKRSFWSRLACFW